MRPLSIGGRGLTARDVLAYAQRVAQSGEGGWYGMCQMFVRMAFGSAGGAPTAVAAWQASTTKHRTNNPPPGAAVYWGGGAGHAAISAGNGWVYSTDVREKGKVSLVRMDAITEGWGKPYLGWSASTNEKRITKWNAQPVAGGGFGAVATNAGGTTDELDHKMLASDYGFTSAFFKGNKSLEKLIRDAVKGQWDIAKFTRRYQNTSYFQHHSAAEREWRLLSTSDRSEADKRRADQYRDIKAQAKMMGLGIPVNRLREMVEDSLAHGWTADHVQDALAAEFHYKAGAAYGGMAGATLDDLRAQAAEYVVPISNNTMQKWTQQVLAGDATPDSFKDYLINQAKSLFPELKGALDAGTTVNQYLDPYRQQAAQILEVAPDTIDWMKPKWQNLVFAVDPDTGKRGVKSLAEAGQVMRTDDRFGFDQTIGARSDAASFVDELGRMLGKTG